MKFCSKCENKDTCKSPCEAVESFLSNAKRKNGVYSQATEERQALSFDPSILDRVLYVSKEFSVEEANRARELFIAILRPTQKEILTLIAEGYSQEEIAVRLNISQSCVSQRVAAIKREIGRQFHTCLERIYP